MASIRGGLFEDEPVQRSSRPGTGLAALFSNTPQTTNVDLAYKPQKQPQSQPQPQTESPTVIFGVTVQLFQFDSTANKFVLKGKVGAAILGSRSAYQLLLYQNNKQQISVTSISSDFAYTIQNNVYGTYYDDSRQSWSLLFKDQPECNKFASYVAIAKAASTGFTAVKSQDIAVGPKGKGVSAGDSLGVKYSGWLIDEQFHIGALFDSNAEKEGFFKFVVGEGKVIRGWEEGVLGMKKGGKRLVAIPSHLAYGKNGYPPTIPANANLLFEIEIVRMKKGSNMDETASQLPVLDTSDVESPALMQNQGGGKSDLAARMAKVGGRPALGGVMTKSKELEDGMIPQRESETQDYSGMMSNLPVDTPHHHVQPMQMQPQMQHSQQQLQLQQQQLAQQQLPQSQFGTVQQYPSQQVQPNMNSYQYSVAPQTGYAQFSQYPQQTPVQNPVAPQASNPRATALSNSDAIQFLLEERQFQAEIKTNLSQVMSKVDDVCVVTLQSSSQRSYMRIRLLNFSGKGQSKSDDYMSGLVIIQNVHRVVDENEKLRSELNQKGEAVDNLRSKISALLEKNEKLIQENTRLLEQRTDSLKESSTQSHKQIQELLDSKKKLEKELNEVQVQSADIESKYLALNRSVTAMKQELESSREDIQKKSHEIELLKSKEISSESSIKKLSSKLEEETTLRKSLQESNQALKDQLADEEENINRLKKEKEKEKTKFASTEARFKEKKAALKTQIAQLQQALKTEGMNKEEIEKMEQDFRNKLKKQEVEIATRVRQEIESIDKPNWEFHSFNKGKVEGIQQGALQGAQQAQADAELRTQAVREQAFKEGKEAGYSQARIDLSSSTTTNPKQVEEAFQKGYSQGKQDGFVTGKQTGFNEGLAQGKQQSVSVSGNADVSKLLQEAKKERDETVKKVMNGVYFALYEEIDEDESYIGSRVLQLMMQTIKAKTLEMIQPDANSESQKQNQEHTEEESDNEEKPVDQTERATIQSEVVQEEPAKEPSEELRSEQEREDSSQTAQAEFLGSDREEPTKEESDREEPAKEESDREEPAKEESDREEPTKEESDREEPTKEESDREEPREESDREQAKEESDTEEPAKGESDADEKLPAQEQTATEELETVKESSLGEPEHEIANDKPEGEFATQAKSEPFDPLSSGQNDEELDVPPIDNTPSESATFEPPQQLSAAEKSGEPDEEEEDDDFGSDNETNVPEPKGLEVDTESKLFDPLENLSDDPLKMEDKRDDATKPSFLQTEEVEAAKAQSPSAVKNAKVSLFGADEDDTEDFFSQVKSVDVTPKKEAAPEPVKTPLSSTKVSLFGEDEDDGADFLGFFAKKT